MFVTPFLVALALIPEASIPHSGGGGTCGIGPPPGSGTVPPPTGTPTGAAPPTSARPTGSAPSGPGSGPPPGPTSGQPGAGRAPANLGPQSPGGGALKDRLDWSHWWQLERDPYLALRSRVRARAAISASSGSLVHVPGTPVGRVLIDDVVIPALLEVLQGERSDNLISSALIAAGRIGAGESGRHRAGLLAGMRMHLRAPSQELSETAVLSLGLLGDPSSLDLLLPILEGGDQGAALLGRGQVPTRTRAFVAFGLAAMAADHDDVALHQRIAHALVACLHESHSRPDVPVAVMLALGHCHLPAKLTLPPRDLLGSDFIDPVMSRGALVRWLMAQSDLVLQDGAASSSEERAFRFVALARLADGVEGSLRSEVLQMLIQSASESRHSTSERSAALMALGTMAHAGEGRWDREALKVLGRALKSGQPMERRFGAVALGQASARPGAGDDGFAGAKEARQALEALLMRGSATERPWGALALGVQSTALAAAGGPDPSAASSGLAELLRKERAADQVGAYALGVALASADLPVKARDRYARSAHETFQKLADPQAKGFVAVALGLLGHHESRDDLLEALHGAKFQPQLLWSSAVGLGLMGEDVTPLMLEVLKTSRTHSSRAAAATALGTVGDQRAARPLVELALDLSRPDSTRAFAIVGLGVLCEDRDLPWRNPIVRAVPYMAPTGTLVGDARGLLDIL